MFPNRVTQSGRARGLSRKTPPCGYADSRSRTSADQGAGHLENPQTKKPTKVASGGPPQSSEISRTASVRRAVRSSSADDTDSSPIFVSLRGLAEVGTRLVAYPPPTAHHGAGPPLSQPMGERMMLDDHLQLSP